MIKVSDDVDGEFKKFQCGDYVMALKYNPDKLDYKWCDTFRVTDLIGNIISVLI